MLVAKVLAGTAVVLIVSQHHIAPVVSENLTLDIFVRFAVCVAANFAAQIVAVVVVVAAFVAVAAVVLLELDVAVQPSLPVLELDASLLVVVMRRRGNSGSRRSGSIVCPRPARMLRLHRGQRRKSGQASGSPTWCCIGSVSRATRPLMEN